MKYLIFYLGFLLTFQVGFIQANLEADELLDKIVKEKKAMGISAAYAINSETIWSNSKGFSDSKTKEAFTTTSLTRIASIAKPMTAIAIMQLVEKGQLDLDAPIQTYLPAFPKSSNKIITVRHLLAHTSGVDSYASRKEAENKVEYPDLEAALAVFSSRALKFEPGTNFHYTTYGYVVLGRIIEKVSGQSYERYMQKNIWDKAGMANTGIEKFGESYPNKTQLYHKKKNKIKKGKANNLSNRAPGGGFYSTVEDLLKFGNAIVEHKLIAASTFELMLENQFKEKEGNPYGLGWFFYGPAPNESVVIGHSGTQTGASTQIMIVPKNKLVVVVLSNTSGIWQDVIRLSVDLIRITEEQKVKE